MFWVNKMKPWLEHYDAGVAHSLVYPDVCVHDFLALQSSRNPDRVAVIYGDQRVNFGEIDNKARNMAVSMLRLGIRSGDRVGICLPNSVEFVISFFAVLRAGGIVVALNPGLTAGELKQQIAITGIRVLITNCDLSQKFNGEDERDLIQELIVCGELPLTAKLTFHSYKDLVGDQTEDVQLPKIESSQAAVLQFSGGTTGTPKAAVGSHRNLVANVTQFRNWLVSLEDGNETYLITIPLYHVYGQVLGLLLGVATGATIVIVKNPRNVNDILQMLREHPVSYFPAVPTIFSMIVNHPSVMAGDLDLTSIKACISGSAPLGRDTQEKFERFTGGYLVEGYGLSEAPTATHCNPILGEKRTGSIGLPLPDVDCRVIDIQTHGEVAIGEPGELLIRGPQVMIGYHNQKDETDLVLRDGWLHTGDVVRMDSDGYFYVVGRIKDLIKVHGLQVWPVEVENIIAAMPGVVECAVAGVPDPKTGERVKVWIVKDKDTQISLEGIQAFCYGKLADFKIPREYEECASLPRSAVGKILRRELIRRQSLI